MTTTNRRGKRTTPGFAAVMARLQERTRVAEENLKERRALETKDAGLSATKRDSSKKPEIRTPARKRGRSSRQLREDVQAELFQQESKHLFLQIPIVPNNQFPTVFTRLPVFLPGTRRKQRQLLAAEEDMALRIETPWGICTRMGPPLTVYDEDTLLGLSDLRVSRVNGEPHKLPIPLKQLAAYNNPGNVQVDVAMGTLTDLLGACGNKEHGDSFQDRYKSLKRLIGTTLIFERLSSQSNLLQPGKDLDIISANWARWEEDGIFLVQFSPAMTYWMRHEFVYIDRKVRARLTGDTAKAVHRFLSSCDKTYKIGAEKLMRCVGYTRDYKSFMRDLKQSLEEMVQIGWLRDRDITGTGRKIPHIVYIEKTEKRKALTSS